MSFRSALWVARSLMIPASVQAESLWKGGFESGDFQLTMKILWSTDAKVGKVSIWLDGTMLADEVGAQTKPDGNDLFIQVGFHRNASEPDVETISIDDAIEGTTLEDVLATPTPPDPGSADAGTMTPPAGSTPGSPSETDAAA